MYITMLVLLRSGGGFGMSLLLSVAGLVAVWVAFRFSGYAWPQWIFTVAWFSAAGIGGGIGSILAWMSLEIETRRQVIGSAILFLVAGLVGAWGGFYIEAILPGKPNPWGSRVISATAIMWATIVPNIVATIYGVVKQKRSGWM
ncbi:MAG: hypothetical protein IIC82_05405 [Chloroflexi bacterium]|nr:hypothetical protein [Chloroflexota bacterium]